MTDAKETEILRDQQKDIDQLIKRIDDAYDRVGRKIGLSPSAFDILYALNRAEGITQKDICDISYTGKQTINASIHKMEREGLIRFEPGTGRSRLIYLTDEGRQLAQRTMVPVVKAENAAWGMFDEDERIKLLRAMRSYSDALIEHLDGISLAQD